MAVTPGRQARRCVLASSNPGKRREFERLLAPLSVDVVSQDSLGIAPADEPFGTFVENALAKARHASQASGMAALADDSGICVPSLNGAPGVYSARYSSMHGGEPGDLANNARLISALRTLDPELSDDNICSAYYYCVLVWMRRADDPQPIIADGLWWGRVVGEAQGEHGFGYDPHFWIASHGCTAADLAPATKNSISHRAIAMKALAARLADG